jgi:cytochrome P450
MDRILSLGGFALTQPSVAFDPESEKFLRDRYTVLNELRSTTPIHSYPGENSAGRACTAFVFTAYEDVLFALRDRRFVRDSRTLLPDGATPPPPPQLQTLSASQRNMLLFRDPPDHTRLRSLVNTAFSPRMVASLEPRIRAVVDELLGPIETGLTFDFVQSVAIPLPVIVIAELLGVPTEDRALFKAWSTAFARTIDYNPSMDTLMEGERVTIDFRDYFRELSRQRRVHPQNDLVSELIQVGMDGDRLSEEELLDMCILILVAGHETTTNLLANGVYLFTQFPDQQSLLREHPNLAESAVEEVLRYEPPVQFTSRAIGEDMEYKGHLLKRADLVDVWMAAAHRDPAVFDNPDHFDITRTNNRHLAFGQGIHYCLGAPLARKEGAIAFAALVQKFAAISLATDDVQWHPSPLFRSLVELKVRV